MYRNIQKPTGPRTIILTGAQIVLNFLVIRMEWLNTIHMLPADMLTESMHCSIRENHMIFL